MSLVRAKLGESKQKAGHKTCFLLFHNLYKMKHFVRAFVGLVFVKALHIIFGLKVFAPKLVNLKTAFVDIEMDIALFKIGRTSFPNRSFRMQSFYRQPCAVADTFSMLFGRNEKNLKFIVMRFFVNLQNYAADYSAVKQYAICFAVWIVDTVFNRLAGDNFAVIIYMVITHTEFFNGTVFE